MKNQVKSFGKLVLMLIIVSFDVKNMTCSIKVKTGMGKWQEYDGVQVSGLLGYKLSNSVDGYEIGKTYKSEMQSQDWRENPFQLIRYTGPTGDPMLLLACVNQKSTKKVMVTLPDGTQYPNYIYRLRNKYDYCRWRDLVKEEAGQEV